MLLHFVSLSPDCVCGAHSRTRFLLDWHSGKTETPEIVMESFVNQVIGPYPKKIVPVLLTQATKWKRKCVLMTSSTSCFILIVNLHGELNGSRQVRTLSTHLILKKVKNKL